jgi:hypothetical protein
MIIPSFVRRHAFVGLGLAFAISLPLLAYVEQDVTVAYPSELWLLVAIYALVSLIFLGLYSLVLKKSWSRLLATGLSIFALMEHFPRLLKLLAFILKKYSSTEQAVLATLFTLVIVGVVVKILELLSNKFLKDANAPFPLVAFVCASFFIFNSYQVVGYLLSHYKTTTYTPTDTAQSVTLSKTSNRDIYYLVLDRYASNDSLKTNFQYDNTAFLDFLKSEGFTIRDSAYSNYQSTAPSIASTVRMGYHTDLATDLGGTNVFTSIPYQTIIKNSPVSKLLKKEGYDIYNYGNWWNVTRTGYQSTNVLADFELTLFGHSWILSEIQSNTLKHTFMQGVFQNGIVIHNHTLVKLTFGQHREVFLDQARAVADLSQQSHTAPRFVFAHLLMPHPPYVFTSTGDFPSYDIQDNDNDVPRSVKYVNQLEYGNTVFRAMLSSILKNSSTPPIIIIQADEGPWPVQEVKDWRTVSDDILQLKTETLAAYYLPDADDSSAITSNVNVFRYVFNHYFGANLDYLPDCTYVYNSDQPFDFVDVTAKLHWEDERCKTTR